MRYILLLFLSAFALFAFKIDVINSDITNGKTLLVELEKEKNIKFEQVLLGEKSYKIFDHPTDSEKSYVLIPVSYYAKADIKELKIEYKKDEVSNKIFFIIEIKKAPYKKEKILVNPSKVNPQSDEVKKRTQKEYAEAIKIYNTYSDKSYLKSKFIMPMDSKITSEFGKARVYNEALKGYHSGTDFRAKKPTPIKCSNNGKVVLAKDRFYAGNSVIVDHGHGIYTCYYHLSEFKVKEGDIVKKGQILGLSGSTGRITGPHLHFAASVGGVTVDPIHFITLVNENLFK